MGDRKARMAALRAKAADKKKDGEADASDGASTITFRNYQPKDDDLKEKQMAPSLAPVLVIASKDEAAAESSVSAGASGESADAGTINIAPKKPNWDLKRDLEGKLTVLNKRTRRALRTLIRQRLETEAEEQGSSSDGSSGESGSSSSGSSDEDE